MISNEVDGKGGGEEKRMGRLELEGGERRGSTEAKVWDGSTTLGRNC